MTLSSELKNKVSYTLIFGRYIISCRQLKFILFRVYLPMIQYPLYHFSRSLNEVQVLLFFNFILENLQYSEVGLVKFNLEQ